MVDNLNRAYRNMTKITAIIASHNRADKTLAAITALSMAEEASSLQIDVVLFDDGSTDGTTCRVSDEFPTVRIVNGDGSSFWAASMAEAERVALNISSREDKSNYLLWMNDDVVLDTDAIGRLVDCGHSNPCAVIVGAMREPESDKISYSGLKKSGRHPLRFQAVVPDSQREIAVDTFNGNLVLVPHAVALQLGGIDGGFSHALADFDYGIRCRKAGIDVFLAPGFYGSCPRNIPNKSSSIKARWKAYIGVKGGGNPSSLARILRKTSPHSWPIILVASYLLWWVRNLAFDGRRRIGRK
jgi:GT2 family glycosyltransferase